MRKLLIIIVLFYSTSLFAETWVRMNPSLGLDFYQSKGYKVVDVKTFDRNDFTTLVYTLTHPEGGFKICNVFLNNLDVYKPEITYCYSEDITD